MMCVIKKLRLGNGIESERGLFALAEVAREVCIKQITQELKSKS